MFNTGRLRKVKVLMQACRGTAEFRKLELSEHIIVNVTVNLYPTNVENWASS
jgi:hypothetical protein